MEWPLWVCCAEACDAVVLVWLDGSFDEVATMVALRCCLDVDAFFVHTLYQAVGAVVVEALELRSESTEDESVVYGCVCYEDGWSFAVLDMDAKDDVAVPVIKDEDVVHAAAGGDKEAACLVSEDLACCCDTDDSCKAGMGAE